MTSPGLFPQDTVAGPDGTEFRVPDGWEAGDVGRCRSCGAGVLWCTTPAGRRAPVDPDGISHFATCPQSNTWRKARR